MPPPHSAAAQAAAAPEALCGDNNLIGMRFDIGKRAVEVKEKA
jgi:hypothetical protein